MRKCIESAVNQRLMLIKKGKSKSDITSLDCDRVIDALNRYQSEKSFRNYIMRNHSLILKIIPASNKKLRARVERMRFDVNEY